MAKKSRTKKKSKKAAKRKVKKTARRPVRRAKKAAKKTKKAKKAKKSARNMKKVKVKAAKKVTKKVMAEKKQMVREIAENVIGKVTHYYDHIGVAVVAVNETIRLGDTIRLKHGKREFEQKISSLQVNHTPITSATKGQEVGMKVDEVADEGTLILPV
ncbi:MAG: hypothetical protein PHX87_06515 [Candidatus Peribacteraceae bacterium]|nr:hypothetical protein [Candidatus Peribacteraceae bacterium]MDD5743042.1 hypothetical protein [Candidatus Peribacteraceae bacterium]